MDWSTSTMVGRSMGIDVAWGDTSKFAIVITQYRNRKVEVFYAESFEKPQMNEIINHIMQLKQRHHITKFYVDGANPEVIRELKTRIGEYHDYYGRLTEEQILVFTQQQQLADNTCQLPEKTQRNAAMDIYLDLRKVHQNTSFPAETDLLDNPTLTGADNEMSLNRYLDYFIHYIGSILNREVKYKFSSI